MPDRLHHPPMSRFASLGTRCIALALLPLACQVAVAARGEPPASAHLATPTSFSPARLTADARAVASWVVGEGDAHGLPFLIVDKRQATVFAFDPAGHLLGGAPALLGLARGDDSVPGIGERKIADIQPHERTTPAGRFAAELGNNSHGEDILWVDYEDAVSMHRVRPVKASERRLQRLASPTPADNRISYGCINIPPGFFDGVVKPLFVPRNGIVYVLPDTKPLGAVFRAAVTRTAHR
jgi:hypothetical protein